MPASLNAALRVTGAVVVCGVAYLVIIESIVTWLCIIHVLVVSNNSIIPTRCVHRRCVVLIVVAPRIFC